MLAWTFRLQCWTVAHFVFSETFRPVGQWILNLNFEGARPTKENRTDLKLIVRRWFASESSSEHTLTLFNSVKFVGHTLTLFNSVKFIGHLWRFSILYGLWGILDVFDSPVRTQIGQVKERRRFVIYARQVAWGRTCWEGRPRALESGSCLGSCSWF